MSLSSSRRHVRDIEDLSEREVLGDRVHDLVYGFVFFHEGLIGKKLGKFPRAASFLVPERRPQRRGNCGLPLPLASMARTKACPKLSFLFRRYRIPFFLIAAPPGDYSLRVVRKDAD